MLRVASNILDKNTKHRSRRNRFRRPTGLDLSPSSEQAARTPELEKQAGRIGFTIQVPLILESLRTNCSSAPYGYRTFYDSIATRR